MVGFTHPAPGSCLASLWQYLARTKNDGKADAKKPSLGEPPARGMSEERWTFPEGATPEKKWDLEQLMVAVEP